MFIVSKMIKNDVELIRIPVKSFDTKEDAENFASEICEERNPMVHTKYEWDNLPRNIDWDLV